MQLELVNALVAAGFRDLGYAPHGAMTWGRRLTNESEQSVIEEIMTTLRALPQFHKLDTKDKDYEQLLSEFDWEIVQQEIDKGHPMWYIEYDDKDHGMTYLAFDFKDKTIHIV